MRKGGKASINDMLSLHVEFLFDFTIIEYIITSTVNCTFDPKFRSANWSLEGVKCFTSFPKGPPGIQSEDLSAVAWKIKVGIQRPYGATEIWEEDQKGRQKPKREPETREGSSETWDGRQKPKRGDKGPRGEPEGVTETWEGRWGPERGDQRHMNGRQRPRRGENQREGTDETGKRSQQEKHRSCINKTYSGLIHLVTIG